jgi:hypothetical protein
MSPLTTASGRVLDPAPEVEPEHPEVAKALTDVADAERGYQDAAATGDMKLIGQTPRALDSARAQVEQARAAIVGRERQAQREAEQRA